MICHDPRRFVPSLASQEVRHAPQKAPLARSTPWNSRVERQAQPGVLNSSAFSKKGCELNFSLPLISVTKNGKKSRGPVSLILVQMKKIHLEISHRVCVLKTASAKLLCRSSVLACTWRLYLGYYCLSYIAYWPCLDLWMSTAGFGKHRAGWNGPPECTHHSTF